MSNKIILKTQPNNPFAKEDLRPLWLEYDGKCYSGNIYFPFVFKGKNGLKKRLTPALNQWMKESGIEQDPNFCHVDCYKCVEETSQLTEDIVQVEDDDVYLTFTKMAILFLIFDDIHSAEGALSIEASNSLKLLNEYIGYILDIFHNRDLSHCKRSPFLNTLNAMKLEFADLVGKEKMLELIWMLSRGIQANLFDVVKCKDKEQQMLPEYLATRVHTFHHPFLLESLLFTSGIQLSEVERNNGLLDLMKTNIYNSITIVNDICSYAVEREREAFSNQNILTVFTERGLSLTEAMEKSLSLINYEIISFMKKEKILKMSCSSDMIAYLEKVKEYAAGSLHLYQTCTRYVLDRGDENPVRKN